MSFQLLAGGKAVGTQVTQVPTRRTMDHTDVMIQRLCTVECPRTSCANLLFRHWHLSTIQQTASDLGQYQMLYELATTVWAVLVVYKITWPFFGQFQYSAVRHVHEADKWHCSAPHDISSPLAGWQLHFASFTVNSCVLNECLWHAMALAIHSAVMLHF